MVVREKFHQPWRVYLSRENPGEAPRNKCSSAITRRRALVGWSFSAIITRRRPWSSIITHDLFAPWTPGSAPPCCLSAIPPCPRPRPPPAPDDRGHLRWTSPTHVNRSAAGTHVDRTKSRTQFPPPSFCSFFAIYPPRSLLRSQDLNQSANATSMASFHRSDSTAQDRPRV